MISDFDFSHLELVSAFKNIGICDDRKLVLTTMTFLNQKDSIAHLEGVEKAFAENDLLNQGKYIKLAAVYCLNNDDTININEPIKVIFNEVNNSYRNVYRNESSGNLKSVLDDVQFVEMVYDRSEDKRVYL